MNALDIYHNAGSPRRAIVKFTAPVRIAKSKTKAVIKDQMEAYLMESNGRLCFYYNPNAMYVFYCPENVESITPIDTMELWLRARKAAEYIKAGQWHGRELDNAFENYDSDEMCAALYRLSLKSEKLHTGILKAFGRTFQEEGKTFLSLTDKELSKHAQESREKAIARMNEIYG